jgi:hypothetical protein
MVTAAFAEMLSIAVMTKSAMNLNRVFIVLFWLV